MKPDLVVGANHIAYFGGLRDTITGLRSLVAFDMDTGAVKFQQTGPAPGTWLSPVFAGADKLLAAEESYDGATSAFINRKLFSLDATGNKSYLSDGSAAMFALYPTAGVYLKAGSITAVIGNRVLASLSTSSLSAAGGTNAAADERPTTDEEQLPEFPESMVRWNYNAIELITAASEDEVFDTLLRTFDGVKPANNSKATVVSDVTGTPASAVGDKLTFPLKGWKGYLHDPLPVRVKRFDRSNHTFSVVTLKGHPLAGWRYFRVFTTQPGHIVIEIAAVDTQRGDVNTSFRGILDFWGFYLGRGEQIRIWQEELEYIKKILFATQGTDARYNFVKGVWSDDSIRPPQVNKPYILNQVCQAAACY